jgi:hypothetical protein
MNSSSIVTSSSRAVAPKHQQHARRRDRHQWLEQAAQAGLQLGLAAHEVADQVDHQRQARGLGGLQAEGAEVEPAPRAVHLHADARQQHDHEQEERERQQPEAALLPGAQPHGKGQRAEHQPQHRVAGLLVEVVERHAGGFLGHGDRGRGHHHQARAEQRERGQRERPVEAVARRRHRQRRLERGGQHGAAPCASSRTSAQKRSPRSS